MNTTSLSEWIAIIPAKGHSDAVQCKNLQILGDMPLFWHSVRYARAEGVTPVVSTDDPVIRRYALERGCGVVDERVDDSSQANCVRQVMEALGNACRYVILQPTSPIRRPGLLNGIMAMEDSCVYTAQRIKVVGYLDGEMTVQLRRQDASRWLWQYDGSILTGTRDMAEAGTLFTPDAVKVEQRSPYTLQIDSVNDFNLMRVLYDYFHCRQ